MTTESVRIVRLVDPSQIENTLSCMGAAPSPWPDAEAASRSWMRQNLGTLVNGLHLADEDGSVVGHLYYAWSEHALLPYRIEERVVVVLCEWVQPTSQGLGYAHELMSALTEQLQKEECKGIIVAATEDEQCMHYRHYERRGFRKLDAGGVLCLMYRPLLQQTIAVQPLRQSMVPTQRHPVEILVCGGGLCVFDTVTALATLEVAREFGERVILREIDPSRDDWRALGIASGTYINGSRLPGGLSERAVRSAILRALGDE